MKRFLCLVLCMVMVSGMFQAIPVTAEGKQGYHLTPTSMMEGGVAVNSKYILKTPDKMDVEEIVEGFSIDGQEAPAISKMDEDQFMIYPKNELEANRIYTFRLKLHDESELTWVYQTAEIFDVAQVFPADKAISVPVNSGIEISFTYENYEDITPYFSISPNVSGKFEKHKKTTVFVPEKLEEGTVYTVTLHKGIKLNGTNVALQEDKVFQFETEKSEDKKPSSQIYGEYDEIIKTVATTEEPTLQLYISRYSEQERTAKEYQLHTTVYQFASIDQYIQAVEALEGSYHLFWANYQRNKINTDDLYGVMSFETTQEIASYTNLPIKIPQALPNGWYLVDTVMEDSHFQALLQSTDISSYYQPGDDYGILWLNDIQLQVPIENATIENTRTGEKFYTNQEGIAEIKISNQPKKENDFGYSEADYLKITTQDAQSSLVITNQYENEKNFYWQFLELDRSLYQPQDTVQFWGFVKNRTEEEAIDQVTVELLQGGYYRYSWLGPRQIMEKQILSVENNVYHGKIQLPNLSQGGYILQVKKGDKVISNGYITVENYTKPSYKMEVIADQKAVFEGDTVQYKIITAFFDGTPLPNLEVEYSIGTYFNDVEIIHDKISTNSQGEAIISYQVPVTKQSLGRTNLYFHARAVLPESGEISKTLYTDLYTNDLMLSAKSDLKGTQPMLQATVNQIDIEKANHPIEGKQGSVEGAPVAGKRIEGNLIKRYYEKIEDGQTYDYINKVTVPKYRYELKEEPVQSFQMMTNEKGIAEYSYHLPQLKEGYYIARLSCKDTRGKEITSELYLGQKPIDDYYYWDTYYLERQTEEKPVAVGEEITFIFKHRDENLANGKIMFLTAQNDMVDYSVQNSPEYKVVFGEEDIPGIAIKGVYFDGYTYHQTENKQIYFDYNSQKLSLTVSGDKESYQPGEECTLTISAKDANGLPKKAAVNISMVDEALFALMNQETDVLSQLYRSFYAYLYYGNNSHGAINNGRQYLSAVGGSGGGGVMKNAVSYDMEAKEEARIRDDFKDTALFATIQLDEKGEGSYTFKLPDNLTSWRITCSGVTEDLYAATGTFHIKTSLPFFINYALSSTFLEGDLPTIGLTAYGDGLKADDLIDYEVSSEKDPAKKEKGQGKAFERINLPLWKMTEGEDNLIIRASAKNGLGDGMRHPIQVVRTYHERNETVYADLTAGISLTGGTSGLTRLTFVDQSRGALLTELLGFANLSGNRIDQKLAKKIAYELVQQYGDDELKGLFEKEPEFNAADYQDAESGGLKIFPYSEADRDVTVKLLPFVKDDVDQLGMLNYFYQKLNEGKKTESFSPDAKALYGLAIYGEPVLIQLNKLAESENSTVLDQAYAALALFELGETGKAEQIYRERILPLVEELHPYYRVNAGENQTDILEATALCAILAAKLNAGEAEGLYDYTCQNHTDELLLNIEKIQYIISKLENAPVQTAKVTYSLFGEEKTQELKNGACFTIKIPSQNINKLQIKDVQGSVGVITNFRAPMEDEMTQSNDIEVERKYSVYGSEQPTTEFKQDDLIQVAITVKFNEKTMNGSYEITDFLPSGLSFVNQNDVIRPFSGGTDKAYIWYAQTDGQKIRFYSSTYQDGERTYYYLARVVSPGTFKADGTLVQSTKADGVMKMLPTQTIQIQ